MRFVKVLNKGDCPFLTNSDVSCHPPMVAATILNSSTKPDPSLVLLRRLPAVMAMARLEDILCAVVAPRMARFVGVSGAPEVSLCRAA